MRTFVLVLGLVAALPGMALSSEEEEGRLACTSDAVRLCAAQIPDRQGIKQCLKANRSQISADCRTVLEGGRLARTE